MIENQKILLEKNQARAIAEKAKQEIEKGNVKDAMLALLMVTPRTGYPYIPEVEIALRAALDSIYTNRYNYKMISGNVDHLLLSDDTRHFALILKDNTLKYYDANTLKCTNRINLPNVDYINTYLSKDGNYFLLQDSSAIYIYNLENSQLILQISTDRLNKKQMQFLKDKFINSKITNSGEFLKYNKSKELDFYTRIEFTNENLGLFVYHYFFGYDDSDEIKPIGLYRLYNKNNNKFLYEKYDYIAYESDEQITSMDLSPNGHYWAIAYVNGNIEIFDTETNESKIWKNPNPNIDGHYSNNIKFSEDSKIIFQTHAFQEYINLLDVKNMCLVDSIKTTKSPEGAFVYLLKNNSILCHFSNETYCYTKGRQYVETIYMKDSFYIDDKNKRIILKDKYGLHTYNVSKVYGENFSFNISRFEQVTGQKIKTDSDGFSLWDLKSDKMIWKYSNIMETYPVAFTSDYNYIFVLNRAFRGGDYISLVEMSEGKNIIDVLCGALDDIYYAEKDNLIFMKEFDNLKVRRFPLYKELLSECFNITKGSSLSKDKKRMFFLE